MGWFKSKAKKVKNFFTKDSKKRLEKVIKKLDGTSESLMLKSSQIEQQIQFAVQRFNDENEAGNKTTAELALMKKQTLEQSLAELKEQIQDLFKRKQLLERAANAKEYHKTLELTTKELEKRTKGLTVEKVNALTERANYEQRERIETVNEILGGTSSNSEDLDLKKELEELDFEAELSKLEELDFEAELSKLEELDFEAELSKLEERSAEELQALEVEKKLEELPAV